MKRFLLSTTLLIAASLAHRTHAALPPLQQRDEIVVIGQHYHIGVPVVLWSDLGGYNAYADSPNPTSQPTTPIFEKVRHVREGPLTDAQVKQVKEHGWTLPFLQQKVDQFVIHYDVTGTSRRCFKVLKTRGLGVQFMLDLDGTVYQTMDLQEDAPHATKANGRSVGVEIANMGGYANIVPLMEWYTHDNQGNTTITIPPRERGTPTTMRSGRVEDPLSPPWLHDGGIRTPNFIGHPARPQIVTGMIQGKTYHQYDFTPQQYESLIHLTAALCTLFPKITCDYPRQKITLGPPTTQVSDEPTGTPKALPSALATLGQEGVLIPHALTQEQYDNYQGVLGHYHVQTDKEDPGPAFQWDKIIDAARNLMTPQGRMNNAQHRNQPARFIPSPGAAPPR